MNQFCFFWNLGTEPTAQTGAVTLIQCFGGSLNLNIHFHMLFLDGIYADNKHGSSRFRWVKAPTSAELTQLTHTIAHRVGRYLERQSLLVRDDENGVFAPNSRYRAMVTPSKRGKGRRPRQQTTNKIKPRPSVMLQ
jgi:hypothetical protein